MFVHLYSLSVIFMSVMSVISDSVTLGTFGLKVAFIVTEAKNQVFDCFMVVRSLESFLRSI